MATTTLHIFAVLACASAFNVDTSSPIFRVSSVPDSTIHFGAAVTIHESAEGPRLLVGAPKSEATNRNISRPGAVYNCPVAGNSTCHYQELEEKAIFPTMSRTGSDVDQSNQLFGQTLISSEGNIVVCAPRYKTNDSIPSNDTTQVLHIQSYYAIGRCLLFNSSYEGGWMFSMDARSNSRRVQDEYLYLVREQFGFSAAMKDGSDLIFGAPGWRIGEGIVYFSNVGYIVSKQDIANHNPRVNNPHSSGEHQGEYLGFSVAIGNFSGSDTIMYAVGRPKADYVTGLVDIFKKNVRKVTLPLVLQVTIKGDKEPGAMFGYALAVVDLNNDQFDDLIVSAPFHGNIGEDNRGKIFAFLSNKLEDFMKPTEIIGPGRQAFFGLALTAVGDIDRDGFSDVAVAAPFFRSSEGVIYIYRGSAQGIQTTFSQAIRGSDLSLMSFGYALTDAVDVDNNKYPDLLIGAYMSESVVLLRTRPVVSVNSSLIAEPDRVDLNATNCVGGRDTICFNMSVCMNFKVKFGADSIGSLNVTYKVTLDISKNRLITKDASGTDKTNISGVVVLHAGSEELCRSYGISVKSGNRYQLSGFHNTLEVVNVSLNDMPSNTGLPPLQPVQDTDIGPVHSYVGLQLLCDPCVPDLSVKFMQMTTSTLQATAGAEDVMVVLQVTNLHDASYGAQLNLSVNSSLLVFSKTVNRDPRLWCDHIPTGAFCRVGFPLRTDDSVEFKLILKQVKIAGNENLIPVKVTVSSEHEESNDTLNNNEQMFDITVTGNATLHIDGAAGPKRLNIGSKRVTSIISEDTSETETVFHHQYVLRNFGPSPVFKVNVRLWLPVFSKSDSRLLSENITVKVENEPSSACDKSYLSVDHLTWPTPSPDLFPLCDGVYICVPINCVISHRINASREVFMTVTSTLNLRNVIFHALDYLEDVASPVEHVTSYIDAIAVADYVLHTQQTVGSLTSYVTFDINVKPCVEIWVVLVSAIGAFLLLGVLVAILSRIGFFKRYKGGEVKMERQRSVRSLRRIEPVYLNAEKDNNMETKREPEVDKRKSLSEEPKDKASSDGSRSGSLDRYRRVKRRRTTGSQSSEDEGVTAELQGESRSSRNWSKPSVKDYPSGKNPGGNIATTHV